MARTWRCPACGMTLSDLTRSCPQCGRRVQAGDHRKEPQSPPAGGAWHAVPPDPGRQSRDDPGRTFRMNGARLNAVSLVLIPPVFWSDALGWTLLVGAFANVAAGVAWILSGVRSGHAGKAAVGATVSGLLVLFFLAFLFMVGVLSGM